MIYSSSTKPELMKFLIKTFLSATLRTTLQCKRLLSPTKYVKLMPKLCSKPLVNHVSHSMVFKRKAEKEPQQLCIWHFQQHD